MVRSAVKFSQRFTSSQQWAAIIALAILISGLSFTYLVSGQLRQQLLVQQQELATNLVKDASILLRTSLSKDDRISANVILQDWVDQELLLSATLYNSTQQPIAEQGLLDLSDYHVFWLEQPVTDENQLIGHLRVAINMSKAYDISRHNAVLLMLSSIMLSFILGGLVYIGGERSLLVRKQQLKAIEDLLAAAEPTLIEQDAYNLNDHKLSISINKLVENIQGKIEVQQALDMFASNLPAAKDATLRHHNSSLLFIKVEGFEELKNNISPKELAQLLNSYHRLLSKAAKLYSGTVDRYSENSILMIFGYPEYDPKEASHCLYAAQLFLGLVDELQKKDTLLQRLSFKLAAHSGPVLITPTVIKQPSQLALSINPELSSNKSTVLTMSGDTVHWTSQLVLSSKEKKLLVSQNLADQLDSSERIQWQSGPEVLDLNTNKHETHWLTALPDTAQKLIARQVKHIVSSSAFSK
jgi:class 3 adenylate cyclase/uncharacterized membrane protein affecting hemolysin expression